MTKIFINCVLLAACTDSTSQPDPPPANDRVITGTATFSTTDESGTSTSFPIGLHETIVHAQFADGDTWHVHEGIANADGTFSIEGVPDGDYWLDLYDVPTGQRDLLWTNADVLAIDQHATGRGDATAANAGTTLTFGPIDGLDTVQDSDGLEFASGNLGFGFNMFGALTPGTTTLQFRRPWAGLPLVSAAKGDRVILTQMRDVTDATSGLSYTSLIKSATLSFEQTDGQDTVVTGTFTTPPQLDYDLRWNRSEFDAVSKDIHPDVRSREDQRFFFRAMPGGSQFGTSVLAPLVLAVDERTLPETGDIAIPFKITNPYPASWLFNQVVMGYPVTVHVPGMPNASLDYEVSIITNTNEVASADHPLRPIVSPVRTPTINGMDLFADHDGVGLTPTIAWQKPAIGQPTAYAISIEHWEIDTLSGGLAPVASLIVPGDVTSVRMPARLLVPGEHYMLQIDAISQAGQDVRVHSLYTLGLPFGQAGMITGTFTP